MLNELNRLTLLQGQKDLNQRIQKDYKAIEAKLAGLRY